MKASHKYDDIINQPHHRSTVHPQMSNYDRAAQFSPFAALTGHEEAIQETARLTDERQELDEYEKIRIDEKLREIGKNPKQEVVITYFQPDGRKSGGAYITHSGKVKRIDEYEHVVIMEDGVRIPIENIWEIERRTR